MRTVLRSSLAQRFAFVAAAALIAFLAVVASTLMFSRLRDLEARVQRLESSELNPAADAAQVVTFSDFGFTLPLPDGADMNSSGLAGGPAGREEGQLVVVAGGVRMTLTWRKQYVALRDAVQDASKVLASAQPALKFRGVNEGDMTVDTRSASFEALEAYDNKEALVAAAVIGAWSCGTGTFLLTVAGTNQDDVDSTYGGLTDGFKCPAS